jgi:hypothetical protein
MAVTIFMVFSYGQKVLHSGLRKQPGLACALADSVCSFCATPARSQGAQGKARHGRPHLNCR